MAPRRIALLLSVLLITAGPTAPQSLEASVPALPGAAPDSARSDVQLLWDRDRWAAAIQALYAARGNAPLWFNGRHASTAAQAFLEEIPHLEERGLQSRDYDPASLRALVAAAERSGQPADIARADRALSTIAARLVSDLQRGRVTPKQVGYSLDLHAQRFDAAEAVRTLADSARVSSTLDALEPQLRHYALLKTALGRYRQLARHPELTVLPPLPRRAVHRGEPYQGAAALRRLLIALGDLPETSTSTSAVLDSITAEGLSHFQKRMSLTPDGVLGRATYRALTVPLAQRAQQIVLSLERVRWLPRTLDAPPIIVNIPQFRLFAFRTPRDAARDILQMDVIVGATFEGRETPVFAADMTYVVLNPYWDVPASILKQELLPHLQVESDWAERNGYEIVAGPGDDAQVVPATPENIARLAAGKLRLRQVPGPENALGRVKFMLPNQHNVYLHDTPTQALFKENRRAFSHGCIRVADPMALLAHVLRNEPGWNAERMAAALAGPPATRIVLTHPIPVFIVYGTALATEAGDTLFFDDIYLQDAKLTRLLLRTRAPSRS
ncbi:MAG TPA: L,D-transpeptidase family protein [Steroidobacteraceae bacterium]